MLYAFFRYYFLIACFICCSACYVFSQDYTLYHKSIIIAEEQAYVKERVNDAIKTYSNIFSQYDFVYVHDCVNAMQLALYANDEKAFLLFTDKAAKNGLLPRHMNMMRYIARHPIYVKNKDSIVHIVKRNRPHYLNRLDTSSLKQMYSLFARDQVEKNGTMDEPVNRHERRYRLQIKRTTEELQELINKKGWPGDKLIGIDQDDILAELNLNCDREVFNFFIKNIPKNRSKLDEYNLAATFVFPTLIHYGSMLQGLENKLRLILYSDAFYMQQITLGNMHPKDVAFLYDEPFCRGDDTISVPDISKGEKYFGTGIKPKQVYDCKPEKIPNVQINKFRAQYFIAPIENDHAKLRFAKKHGMFMGWGFGAARV